MLLLSTYVEYDDYVDLLYNKDIYNVIVENDSKIIIITIVPDNSNDKEANS